MTKALGRQTSALETLKTLIKWADGRDNFVAWTGLKSATLNAYLDRSREVPSDRLKRWAECVLIPYLPTFSAVAEHAPLTELKEISQNPGVYALFDSAARVIYFGQATQLQKELRQTLARPAPRMYFAGNYAGRRFADVTAYFSAYEIHGGDAAFRHDVEALVLRTVINNTLNKKVGHFKMRGE